MSKIISEALCIQCGMCEDHCPEEAIKHNDIGYLYIDVNKCTDCGDCAANCPTEAITL